MTNSVDNRITELGIEIPEPPKAVASYVGWVRTGNLIYVSGQIPVRDGNLTMTGKVGDTVTVEQAQQAAQVCAINIIAQLKDACDGNLERLNRIIKLTGYVSSAPDFTDQALVINGASNLIGEVFAEAGVHSRAAVGVAVLPLDASVEVDAIAEISD